MIRRLEEPPQRLIGLVVWHGTDLSSKNVRLEFFNEIKKEHVIKKAYQDTHTIRSDFDSDQILADTDLYLVHIH